MPQDFEVILTLASLYIFLHILNIQSVSQCPLVILQQPYSIWYINLIKISPISSFIQSLQVVIEWNN